MIHRLKLGFFAAALFSLPLAASAQNRAVARPAMRPVQAVAQHISAVRSATNQPIIIQLAARPGTHGTATQTNTTRDAFILSNTGINQFPFSGLAPFNLTTLTGNNVPGLGFDFSHLAALNQNLGERAFIDPVTQEEIGLNERLLQSTPVFGGVVPFLGGYSEPMVQEEQQQPTTPQVIVLQESASSASAPSAPTAPVQTEGPSPLPDVGEFVLVLHNGSQIKAVAFTRQNDKIVYIGEDGTRDSFPATDLNAAATQQVNQKRGTPLHLSL